MQWVIGIGVLILLWLVGAFFFQRRLIYLPPDIHFKDLTHMAARYGFRLWQNAQTSPAFGYISTPPSGSTKGCIVYFHGNASHVLENMHFVMQFDQRAWTLALHEYPGYSGIPGRPTKEEMTIRARQAVHSIQHLRPLVFVGRSLGGAVASAVAEEIQPDALILISPFNRLTDVAWKHYPYFLPGLTLLDRWDNERALARVNCPLMIIHGESDKVIPVEYSIQLFHAYHGPKQLVAISAAAHNDIVVGDKNSVLWKSIGRFLSLIER